MAGKWEDENLISKPLLDFLKSGEHLCINVEGALIDAVDDGTRGVFFHCMNPNAVRVFEKIGADIWSIGNNHTMDAGREGVVSTKEHAKKSGALAFGAGLNDKEASEPIYLDEAGGIGIFGVSYMAECIPATKTDAGVFRWDDMEYIQARIDEIKSKCRWCIVVAHGGEEFAPMPNPYTRDRYLKYLEMGADAVVAHHTHVPENYEITKDGKPIFYSLGNFIFDTDYQRVHKYTDTGIVLKLNFTLDSLEFEAVGTKINRQNETIDINALPDIFTNIDSEEFALLSPLSAKAFIISDMRKMQFLEPDRFINAEQSVWDGYFFSTEPDGYFEGAHMDLSVIVPLSKEAEKNEWQKSKLDKVKNYILKQIEG
ncbi:MAG: CapA family protein [Clostridia bacterium]|nr:CapA family protein [Clostridia bacterium]